jgi:dihydroorotate dehydrogenase (fumarate)
MSPAQLPPPLKISPPLLNSANPWATTREDLQVLFSCKSTGAVTVRTSLLKGFNHQDAIHTHGFFDPGRPAGDVASASSAASSASLNTLGYSPITLAEYLSYIAVIAPLGTPTTKVFLVSVTGSPEDVVGCYELILAAQKTTSAPLAMEINLSCPNIPGAPPPAYNGGSLLSYLGMLPAQPALPIGLKTPPYTHAGEYKTLIQALVASCEGSNGAASPCRISFITGTNTLGSCLVLDASSGKPYLPGSGIGGMAGPPLHPLALGNVCTIRKMLDEDTNLKHIQVIGIGGVSDAAGYKRMRSVGAYAVGVGTALGKEGVAVFSKIESELKGEWSRL